jgi:hypothetical protein
MACLERSASWRSMKSGVRPRRFGNTADTCLRVLLTSGGTAASTALNESLLAAMQTANPSEMKN